MGFSWAWKQITGNSILFYSLILFYYSILFYWRSFIHSLCLIYHSSRKVILSGFLFALVTDRALLVDWPERGIRQHWNGEETVGMVNIARLFQYVYDIILGILSYLPHMLLSSSLRIYTLEIQISIGITITIESILIGKSERGNWLIAR